VESERSCESIETTWLPKIIAATGEAKPWTIVLSSEDCQAAADLAQRIDACVYVQLDLTDESNSMFNGESKLLYNLKELAFRKLNGQDRPSVQSAPVLPSRQAQVLVMGDKAIKEALRPPRGMIHAASLGPSGFTPMLAEVSDDNLESHLASLFKEADKNDDGSLSSHEFAAFLSSSGFKLSPEVVAEMMTAADVKKTGVIDYQDFIPVALQMRHAWLLSRGLVVMDQDRGENGLVEALSGGLKSSLQSTSSAMHTIDYFHESRGSLGLNVQLATDGDLRSLVKNFTGGTIFLLCFSMADADAMTNIEHVQMPAATQASGDAVPWTILVAVKAEKPAVSKADVESLATRIGACRFIVVDLKKGKENPVFFYVRELAFRKVEGGTRPIYLEHHSELLPASPTGRQVPTARIALPSELKADLMKVIEQF